MVVNVILAYLHWKMLLPMRSTKLLWERKIKLMCRRKKVYKFKACTEPCVVEQIKDELSQRVIQVPPFIHSRFGFVIEEVKMKS